MALGDDAEARSRARRHPPAWPGRCVAGPGRPDGRRGAAGGTAPRGPATTSGQLLDEGAVTLDALRGPTVPIDALLAVAGYCRQTLRWPLASDRIDRRPPGDWASWHCTDRRPPSASWPRNRCRIRSCSTRLLRDARGPKDKNVYRILKSKRDALHAQERAAAEALATMTTLCASIERHIHQPFSSAYVTAAGTLHQATGRKSPHRRRRNCRPAQPRRWSAVGRSSRRHLQQLAREAAGRPPSNRPWRRARRCWRNCPQLLAAAYEEGATDTDTRLAALTSRWNELLQFRSPTRALRRIALEQLRSAVAPRSPRSMRSTVRCNSWRQRPMNTTPVC